jgi:hypothetical protein
MVTTVNIALKTQARDELLQRFAALFARRNELAAAAEYEQAKRLDADIEEVGRRLYDAERALRMAT